MDSPLHLVRRLWTSLFDRDLDSVQERRLLELLNEKEADLYRLQPNVDKLHSIRGAVSVLNEISVGHDTDLVIAAALHDVGKTETGLNVSGRVVATIFQTFLKKYSDFVLRFSFICFYNICLLFENFSIFLHI